MSAGDFRIETDSIGEKEIPADALYGINGARAVENFPAPSSSLGEEPELCRAFAKIKKAAAVANASLGVLSREIGSALEQACEEMEQGELNKHLVVPLLEGSGGTSLNMNVNEVIARRATQILSNNDGQIEVHPNDHANLSQSTNDAVPSAMRLAVSEMAVRVANSLEELAETCAAKAAETRHIVRLGRTCLQDAQPMHLGQYFGGMATFASRRAAALSALRAELVQLPMGATAIGTGFGAPPGYSDAFFEALNQDAVVEASQADDLFDAMANGDDFVRLAGELNAIATGLGKIAQDLIILSSGPSGGLAEIRLPAVQAGSSIMPGKVNPVIPIFVRQCTHLVTGYSVVVSNANSDGLLEINHFEPVMSHALFSSLRLIESAVVQLGRNCIAGIEPNEARMRENLLASSAVSTWVKQNIGYEAASRLVKLADKSGQSFIELACEEGLLTKDDVEAILNFALNPTQGS